MATTRIISMHVNQGKTIADCLTDRIDYSKNPKKTQGGELISAYECDPKTADAEFLYSKRQYQTITGREQRHDVIAYQVRQSFKPGEITPEDANRIGYEFAERFLKGRHAFFVATHTDKKHIHNHIIWNSTTLDCKRMLPVQIAVHQGNGGGIPVKGVNQHGNFCQTCLPGSIQAAVAADDFIFIAVFNGTDDQRGKNTILPDTFRKSSHLLVVLYLVGMAFKRAQLFNS